MSSNSFLSPTCFVISLNSGTSQKLRTHTRHHWQFYSESRNIAIHTSTDMFYDHIGVLCSNPRKHIIPLNANIQVWFIILCTFLLMYGWIGGLNRRMSGTEEGQINRKIKKPLTKVLDHQNSTTAPLCLFLKCLESHWSAGHYSSKRYSLICFDDVGEDCLMVKHLPQAFIWIEML